MTKVFNDRELTINAPESCARLMRIIDGLDGPASVRTVNIPMRSDTRFADTVSLLDDCSCNDGPHTEDSDAAAHRESEHGAVGMMARVVLYTLGLLAIIALAGIYAQVRS